MQALAQSGALQAAPGRSLAQPGASKKQRYFHYFEWDDNTVFELSPLREEERFQTASQIKQMGLLEHQNVWKVRCDLGNAGIWVDAQLRWQCKVSCGGCCGMWLESCLDVPALMLLVGCFGLTSAEPC